MLITDIVLILMLAICIIYCTILNQRIKELYNSKNQLLGLIKELDIAILRAESVASDLSKVSKDTLIKMHSVTEQAQFLLKDLNLTNDLGHDIINRLNNLIQLSKKEVIPSSKPLIKDLDMQESAPLPNAHKTSIASLKNNIETLISKISASSGAKKLEGRFEKETPFKAKQNV